ncbi:hypothetical protein NDU88_006699 [Pleurodeles waltl]|uniref:Uncharacterized protein n=1 Tax=Pleurodeles waltl TaxID=8319 RepID=A0AAV7PML6_PLEWA|nr:hypothetical protein NDU88_006699 [Pleurodeles waltl]
MHLSRAATGQERRGSSGACALAPLPHPMRKAGEKEGGGRSSHTDKHFIAATPLPATLRETRTLNEKHARNSDER